MTNEENDKGGSSPYSEDSLGILKMVQDKRIQLLEEITDGEGPKLSNDKDKSTAFIALANSISADIHKRTNLESRHDLGIQAGETAEAMAGFLQEIHKSAQQTFTDRQATDGERDTTVPDGIIEADIVPGMLDTGIVKPTLKEIMNVKLDEED